jgi:hypothetical protein
MVLVAMAGTSLVERIGLDARWTRLVVLVVTVGHRGDARDGFPCRSRR